ncbi:MAG: hypothetical protein AAGB15_05675 [Pseudomonadota bacterium]
MTDTTPPERPADTSPAARLTVIAARPARLIPLICQMILGVALLIALVLKAYMAVLTDHQCVAEETSLGNLLRCEPTLLIMANILALSAGFELVRCLFAETMERVIGPVILALTAALLMLVGGFPGGAGWREALVLAALVAAIGGIAWIGKALLRR